MVRGSELFAILWLIGYWDRYSHWCILGGDSAGTRAPNSHSCSAFTLHFCLFVSRQMHFEWQQVCALSVCSSVVLRASMVGNQYMLVRRAYIDSKNQQAAI